MFTLVSVLTFGSVTGDADGAVAAGGGANVLRDDGGDLLIARKGRNGTELGDTGKLCNPAEPNVIHLASSGQESFVDLLLGIGHFDVQQLTHGLDPDSFGRNLPVCSFVLCGLPHHKWNCGEGEIDGLPHWDVWPATLC